MPDTLVLGLGNLLREDDGFGVHAIRRLEQDAGIPPGVTLLDGGTHGLALLPHISGYRRLLVIDAVDTGEASGELLRLEGDACANLPGRPSVHQLGFADLMIALKLLGDGPEDVVLLGVQPQSMEWATELTPPVRAALERIPGLVLDQLAAWSR